MQKTILKVPVFPLQGIRCWKISCSGKFFPLQIGWFATGTLLYVAKFVENVKSENDIEMCLQQRNWWYSTSQNYQTCYICWYLLILIFEGEFKSIQERSEEEKTSRQSERLNLCEFMELYGAKTNIKLNHYHGSQWNLEERFRVPYSMFSEVLVSNVEVSKCFWIIDSSISLELKLLGKIEIWII